VQVIDPRFVDIVKKRHGQDPVRVRPLLDRHVEANDRATETMVRDTLWLFDASDPPAAALHALEKPGLGEKIQNGLAPSDVGRQTSEGSAFTLLSFVC
jgi:hypothetical protein